MWGNLWDYQTKLLHVQGSLSASATGWACKSVCCWNTSICISAAFVSPTLAYSHRTAWTWMYVNLRAVLNRLRSGQMAKGSCKHTKRKVYACLYRSINYMKWILFHTQGCSEVHIQVVSQPLNFRDKQSSVAMLAAWHVAACISLPNQSNETKQQRCQQRQLLGKVHELMHLQGVWNSTNHVSNPEYIPKFLANRFSSST